MNNANCRLDLIDMLDVMEKVAPTEAKRYRKMLNTLVNGLAREIAQRLQVKAYPYEDHATFYPTHEDQELPEAMIDYDETGEWLAQHGDDPED